MTILLLILLATAASFLAGLLRHRLATLVAVAGVVLVAYLLGLQVSGVGDVLAIAAGLVAGISLAVAARIAFAISHPAVAVLDAVRLRTGHSRIGLVVAMVRLLVAGRRLLLR
jgi:hypothetical protein